MATWRSGHRRREATRNESAPRARLLAAALVVLLACGRAGAEPTQPAPSESDALRVRARQAKVERGMGIALSALGLSTAALGGLLLGVSGRAPYDQGQRYQLAGAFTVVGGIALSVTGAGLAIDGQNRLSDLGWRLRLLGGLYLAPAPSAVVAGLAIPF